MALLVFLLVSLFAAPWAHAEWKGEVRLNVFFDRGNPSNSVGIFNDEFLEVGDRIDQYEVLHFGPESMILKDVRDGSPLKLPADGGSNPQLLRHGRYLFVVKQLRVIREAQVKYEKEFNEGYALDLETMIHHGFLPDGFSDDAKQGYRFSIVKTGNTKPRYLQYQNEPTFLAVAEPLMKEGEPPPYYFSVDYLGAVRFAESKEGVSWGPVWDYANVLETLIVRDIKVRD